MTTPTQPIPLTDLRVGNAVTRNLDNEIVIVTQINSDEGEIRCYKLNDSFYKTVCFSGGFSGIPITEEWMEKLGFFIDKVKAHKVINDTGVIFQLNRIGNEFEFTWNAVPIKTVSHLQNIYYFLTGTELTIK